MPDISNSEIKTYKPFRRSVEQTDEDEFNKTQKLANIKLDKLRNFEGHPFRLYEGERLNDLVQDIKQRGVIQPICVRNIGDGKYEILAGHNRVNASKIAGLDTIPAMIYDSMSDEDAKIYVVQSNYNQRSVTDLKPSELANSLHMLNEAMKKKSGYRSDLEETTESSNEDNRLRTMNVIGKEHNLSQASIARYIRIAHLVKELQEKLDNKIISMAVAVQLSYLKESEQKIVETLLEPNVRINIEQVKTLRRESESLNGNVLSDEMIREILEPNKTDSKIKSIKLDSKFLSQFFDDNQSEEDIQDTIAKALELYHSK